MYETVLKQIAYNYEIPKDIIQLIYNELNKKNQCAIMIQDEIKRLIAEKPRRLCGIKYFMIEQIYDEPHCFLYKSNAGQIILQRDMYSSNKFIYYDDYAHIAHIAYLYKKYNNYGKKILEGGFNMNGFFKDYKNEYNITIIYV